MLTSPRQTSGRCVCAVNWRRRSGCQQQAVAGLSRRRAARVTGGVQLSGFPGVGGAPEALGTMPLWSRWRSMRMAVHVGWPTAGAPAGPDVGLAGQGQTVQEAPAVPQGLGPGTASSFAVPWETVGVRPTWLAGGLEARRPAHTPHPVSPWHVRGGHVGAQVSTRTGGCPPRAAGAQGEVCALCCGCWE